MNKLYLSLGSIVFFTLTQSFLSLAFALDIKDPYVGKVITVQSLNEYAKPVSNTKESVFGFKYALMEKGKFVKKLGSRAYSVCEIVGGSKKLSDQLNPGLKLKNIGKTIALTTGFIGTMILFGNLGSPEFLEPVLILYATAAGVYGSTYLGGKFLSNEHEKLFYESALSGVDYTLSKTEHHLIPSLDKRVEKILKRADQNLVIYELKKQHTEISSLQKELSASSLSSYEEIRLKEKVHKLIIEFNQFKNHPPYFKLQEREFSRCKKLITAQPAQEVLE